MNIRQRGHYEYSVGDERMKVAVIVVICVDLGGFLSRLHCSASALQAVPRRVYTGRVGHHFDGRYVDILANCMQQQQQQQPAFRLSQHQFLPLERLNDITLHVFTQFTVSLLAKN